MKTDWDVDAVTIDEIKVHLEQFHNGDFWARNSLTDWDFIWEHFQKDIASRGIGSEIESTEKKRPGMFSTEGKRFLAKADSKLRAALKKCEIEGIQIARVYDYVTKGNHMSGAEWRVCKPSRIQIRELKTCRWEPIIVGWIEKIQRQAKLAPRGQDIPFKEIVDDVAVMMGMPRRKKRKLKIVK